ncbi:DUF1801 domain-containing protein [Microlunatus panaciterrae]|uniref:iron chaperone n=1 Tax=Microlunatus panaciterrae TaxID=400768 RepID=UPI0030844B2F
MRRGYPAATVEDYLRAVPEHQRAALSQLRSMLVDLIPGVEEVISYQIPVFKYRGRGLVGMSAAQKHCSLHLMSPRLARAMADQVQEGRMSGATLQFSADAPLSEATVRAIVERRIAEVEQQRG